MATSTSRAKRALPFPLVPSVCENSSPAADSEPPPRGPRALHTSSQRWALGGSGPQFQHKTNPGPLATSFGSQRSPPRPCLDGLWTPRAQPICTPRMQLLANGPLSSARAHSPILCLNRRTPHSGATPAGPVGDSSTASCVVWGHFLGKTRSNAVRLFLCSPASMAVLCQWVRCMLRGGTCCHPSAPYKL